MSRQPLPEQQAVHSYNQEQRIPKRRSATQEERDAYFQGTVPAPPRQTLENDLISANPRSVLRYRPIESTYIIPFTDGSEMRVTEHELGTLPQHYQRAAQLITPQLAAPRQRRQPRPKVPVQDASVYELPPARTDARETEEVPRQKHRRVPRFHWLFWVGLIVLLMIVGWYGFTVLGNWWSTTVEDWQYGRPRTYQIDANVGHGTAHNPDSHFIAQNLNRQIMVIEEPGDNPGKSKIYVGPTLIGKGQELTPVTLSFEDVNNDGRADLVIHLGDGKVVLLNQKDGTFTPAPTQ